MIGFRANSPVLQNMRGYIILKAITCAYDNIGLAFSFVDLFFVWNLNHVKIKSYFTNENE